MPLGLFIFALQELQLGLALEVDAFLVGMIPDQRAPRGARHAETDGTPI